MVVTFIYTIHLILISVSCTISNFFTIIIIFLSIKLTGIVMLTLVSFLFNSQYRNMHVGQGSD
jgi:hypothetical protein